MNSEKSLYEIKQDIESYLDRDAAAYWGGMCSQWQNEYAERARDDSDAEKIAAEINLEAIEMQAEQ
jgi:hypothetical protein